MTFRFFNINFKFILFNHFATQVEHQRKTQCVAQGVLVAATLPGWNQV